jgi:hypothetical protein
MSLCCLKKSETSISLSPSYHSNYGTCRLLDVGVTAHPEDDETDIYPATVIFDKPFLVMRNEYMTEEL